MSSLLVDISDSSFSFGNKARKSSILDRILCKEKSKTSTDLCVLAEKLNEYSLQWFKDKLAFMDVDAGEVIFDIPDKIKGIIKEAGPTFKITIYRNSSKEPDRSVYSDNAKDIFMGLIRESGLGGWDRMLEELKRSLLYMKEMYIWSPYGNSMVMENPKAQDTFYARVSVSDRFYNRFNLFIKYPYRERFEDISFKLTVEEIDRASEAVWGEYDASMDSRDGWKPVFLDCRDYRSSLFAQNRTDAIAAVLSVPKAYMEGDGKSTNEI